MKKLRLLQERTKHQENYPGDLRGIEDPALLKRSVRETQLVVAGIELNTQLSAVAEAYGLAATQVGPTVRFAARIPGSGEHKHQAVAAFFAALEVSKAHPGARLLITERDGLREELGQRIHPDQFKSPFEAKVETWLASRASRFRIEHSVVHSLHQSGLPVETSASDAELDAEGLKLIRSQIDAAASAPAKTLRKAA